MYEFRWIDWNIEKCASHGVNPSDVESAVRNARRPYPKRIEDEKILIWGQSQSGRHLQVILLVEEDDCLFVIHARPLTPKEVHSYRRKIR